MMSLNKIKSPAARNILGMAVLALALLMVLTGGRKSVDPATVETQLAKFSGFAAELAAAHGRNAQFTHDGARSMGWLLSKTVEIAAPKLELTGPARMIFSTPRVRVEGDPLTLERLHYIFSDPVAVTKNGQPAVSIKFSSPLKYVYFDGRDEQGPVIRHALALPAEIVLEGPAAEDAQPGRTVISYEAPRVLGSLRPDSGERKWEYQFQDLRIVAEDGAALTIASLMADFVEKPIEGNRVEGHYTLNIADAAYRTGEGKAAPYSMAADIGYTADRPPGDTGGRISATVNTLALMADDFEISAKGEVVASIDDPLPYGRLEVTFNNVGGFLQSGLVGVPMRPLAAAALAEASGQKPDALAESTTIVLSRKSGGVLYVGEATFEELAGRLLTGALLPSAPSPATPAE